MLTMLKNWNGTVEVNGNSYEDIQSVISNFKPTSGQIHIVLHPRQLKPQNGAGNGVQTAPGKKEYKVTVKRYMTQPASPEFDFMAKFNHNEPMPLRTMVGTVEKETRGMVYMKLHGDIYADRICTCMKCGKQLTNPVSQYFGIGPECGGHNYVNPFNSEEELRKAVEEYRKKLLNMTWEGWVIKSAITAQEEVC